jgi:peptide/nickel transport system permease protein
LLIFYTEVANKFHFCHSMEEELTQTITSSSTPDGLWKSLRKKPIPLISLIFILFCAIISILAYLFIEDATPNANEQMPEIALSGPGFSTRLLLLPKIGPKPSKSLLDQWLFGKENTYIFQPFRDLSFNKDDLQLTTHYGQIKYIAYGEILGEKQSNAEQIIREKYIKNQSFILGTDKYGRSVFSRLILGIRVSLAVGLLAVLISLTLGIFIGAVAGYFGGWIDQLAMFLINVTWSIPTLLLVFAIVLAFGRGVGIIFLAVGLTMWVDVARIVRGQVLKTKQEQYIVAARSLGYGSLRVIFKHILPNIIGPILVIAAANFATAILLEAGLSYLGFGIKPPAPSIGNMLNENYGYALSNKPFLAIVPAVTIMLLVLSFNLVGSGLRDIFDVKQKSI